MFYATRVVCCLCSTNAYTYFQRVTICLTLFLQNHPIGLFSRQSKALSVTLDDTCWVSASECTHCASTMSLPLLDPYMLAVSRFSEIFTTLVSLHVYSCNYSSSHMLPVLAAYLVKKSYVLLKPFALRLFLMGIAVLRC